MTVSYNRIWKTLRVLSNTIVKQHRDEPVMRNVIDKNKTSMAVIMYWIKKGRNCDV